MLEEGRRPHSTDTVCYADNQKNCDRLVGQEVIILFRYYQLATRIVAACTAVQVLRSATLFEAHVHVHRVFPALGALRWFNTALFALLKLLLLVFDLNRGKIVLEGGRTC